MGITNKCPRTLVKKIKNKLFIIKIIEERKKIL